MRAQESTPLRRNSFHSVSTRLVSTPPAPVPLGSFDAGISLRSPPSMPRPPPRLPRLRLPPPPPYGDVAVCYDLHSSRNKTSATVLRPPTTINEKPCTKCITTSHVPAAKGHALTSHFFPYLLLHFSFFFFFASSLLSSLPAQSTGRPIFHRRSAPLSFRPYRISPSPLFLLRAIILATPVDTCHSPNLCHFKHEFICTAYLRAESVKYHRYAALDRR